MEKASFSITRYIFDKVIIDLEARKSKDIFVNFIPSGVLNTNDSTFDLTFEFHAFSSEEKDNDPFIFVRCIGTFQFNGVKSLEDIPSFFYRNSIALLFPYVRAYVSLITNQANVSQVMLPTMNLTSLEAPLKENTTQK
ncbi:protein-export chaperone SecB [Arenibacter lacus]|uniref:protein-export chaperone SecB n=1 Tax=Arenibacter lacus TaxID=2608629 RepID=UPI00123D430B|nr:protein-export chaperone SecB [Arenibacter lacus]